MEVNDLETCPRCGGTGVYPGGKLWYDDDRRGLSRGARTKGGS